MNISLHLGAHKTASTFLQRHFKNSLPTLKKSGVNYIGPSALRKSNINFSINEIKKNSSPALIKETAEQLKTIIHSCNHNHTIISEENLIGTCRNFKNSSKFYGNSEQKLQILSKLINDNISSVFLATRSYDSFFPSSYGQSLRGSKKYFTFEEYYSKQDISASGWPDLISTIKKVFPKSKLYLWDYKKTFDSSFRNKLIDLMTDSRLSSSLQLNDNPVNTAMTEKAINTLGLLNDSLSVAEYDQIRNFFDNKMTWDSPDKFNPFNADETSSLKKHYTRHLTFIKENYDNVFILE